MNDLRAIKQRFGIIGTSPLLDAAIDTAARVAATALTVLITGESGVGKENISKIIHQLSPRKHEGFIAINCGAIPEGTINSELFGHEKGSFTNAVGQRKGYFETYNGGTIFLDEVGEMPLDTQSYLLRILESGEFIRMGSSEVLHTDVRIVAATNVDLIKKIKSRKLREDLYYRLNTVPIQVPPLRERREDIYLLFRKFAVDFADRYGNQPIQLDEDSRRALESYSWPGNIRELKNVAEQLSVLSESQFVTLADIQTYVPQILKRNLPVPHIGEPDPATGGTERDILYKFLLEMKQDLDQVKKVLSGLIQENDLETADSSDLFHLHRKGPAGTLSSPVAPPPTQEYRPAAAESGTIILRSDQQYDDSEVVDECLDLEELEKKTIQKALEKHRGKRKEAADELGISERTLYRKIKQYELI